MVKISSLLIFATFFTFVPFSYAALQREAVEYQDGDQTLEGYLVYDDALAGKRPAVIVVHEWKGLGDYAKRRADMLAEMGYLAFAADMYGKGVRAVTHEEAGKLAGMYLNDREKMRKRAASALDFVAAHELAEPGKVAAIGYCFGGTTVLEMARAGLDVKGVASFHGALKTPSPAPEGGVKARIMVFHGSQDTFIAPEDITGFEKEMSSAGADWQLVVFSKAVHSFTVAEAGDNPASGVAYNREADERSWKMLTLFFREIFS